MIIIFALVTFVLAENTMVINWGRVINASDPSFTAAISWEDCVSTCYESTYCVLAFGRSGYCSLYNFGMVFEVLKWLPADGNDGNYVAFKTSSGDSSCPETPFENFQVEILDLNYQYTTFMYTLIFVSDLWMFEYTVNRTCPPDWKTFTRPSTKFCLKLFTNVNKMYTYADATALCQAQNATLGGLESDEERVYVYETGSAVSAMDSFKGGGYRVDGHRKESCMSPDQWNTTDCYKTKAFEFTDKYLTTYGGYKWVEGRPDGFNSTLGAFELCVQLWTQKGVGDLAGNVDDTMCESTNTAYFAVRGYLCGKVPGN